MKLTVASSPHIRGDFRTSRIMLDVVLALLPALAVGAAFQGPRALIVALLGLTPEELTWEKTKRLPLPVHPEAKAVTCSNPKCVTNNDRAVKPLARPTEDGHWACEYCDTVMK